MSLVEAEEGNGRDAGDEREREEGFGGSLQVCEQKHRDKLPKARRVLMCEQAGMEGGRPGGGRTKAVT